MLLAVCTVYCGEFSKLFIESIISWFCRSPSAKSRIREEDEVEKSYLSINNQSTDSHCSIQLPSRSYQVFYVESTQQPCESVLSATSLRKNLEHVELSGHDFNSTSISNDGWLATCYAHQNRNLNPTTSASIGMGWSLTPRTANSSPASVNHNQTMDDNHSRSEDFTKYARSYLYGCDNWKISLSDKNT